jgi:hypothetical protein
METAEKATEKQVKYLHILYSKLHWDEDMYRSMLLYNFQVTSSKDLTKDQAFAFITSLNILIEKMELYASSKQIFLIKKLWAPVDYSQGQDGDTHLLAFVKRFYKVDKLEQLTKAEAIKLIKQIGELTKQAETRKGKTTVLRRRCKCSHCGSWIMWVQLSDGRREAFDCDHNKNATDFHKCYGK